MALKKTTTLANGVTAEYFKITDFELVKHEMDESARIMIMCSLYVNQQIRQSGTELCVDRKCYSIKGSEVGISIDPANVIESAYAILKTLPEFEGAEDC